MYRIIKNKHTAIGDVIQGQLLCSTDLIYFDCFGEKKKGKKGCTHPLWQQGELRDLPLLILTYTYLQAVGPCAIKDNLFMV